MTEKADFKIPNVDPKVLTKLRKSGLPASVSKADIAVPTGTEPNIAEQFEQNNVEIPPIPYKEPSWSRKCDPSQEYSFEVEKNGVIVDKIKQLQSKPFWLFGRLPNCDINMAHPTISRYHAIFQYRAPLAQEQDEEASTHRAHATNEPGWYLYDLNSTHGTFLNKQQIPPRTYVLVRVGYMIKLGSSSRTYIFQGPSDDGELGLTITEMREHIKKRKEMCKEVNEITRKEQERIEKLQQEQQGITWGMAEDADEETDLTENPYATSNNEELFLDDPKKTLRGYFEREGHELEYKVEELSSGTYCCKVELPIDDADGRPIVAEVTNKGKKKEVVVQCALEACRVLDRQGLLRQANHEPRRRFQKQSDSDDDDDFLDRTGAVEKRRQRKEAAKNPQTHTYADLIHKEAQILERLETNESKIQNARLIKQETHLPENADDVDKFLDNLTKDKVIDKFEVRRLRMEQVQLNEELAQVKKLIQITKPVDIDKIGLVKHGTSGDKRPMLPLYGHGGYEAISPQTHVLSFLWFLGHDKTSYRDVASQFNLSKGSQQMYQLGKLLRPRYYRLLPPNGLYSKEHMTIVSSYAERCIMSAQSFIAGFLPPLENTNPLPIPWQPAAVNVLPRDRDTILAQKQPCPRYEQSKQRLVAYPPKDIRELYEKNAALFRTLSQGTGQNVSTILDVELLYNTLEIEKSAGLELPDWTEGIFPQKMLPIAERSLALITELPLMKKIKGGAIVAELLDNAIRRRSGILIPERNIFIYSGHDVTLVNFMRALNIIDQTTGKPDFSAAIVFELHHSITFDDDFEVKIVYFFNSDDKYPKEIEIPNCESPCSLTKFEQVMETVRLRNYDETCQLV
uniref:FHA domain-containing protein n=1 Tax=Anopheles merus TaxID=30066 RepID=A0A182VBG9_ANOME